MVVGYCSIVNIMNGLWQKLEAEIKEMSRVPSLVHYWQRAMSAVDMWIFSVRRSRWLPKDRRVGDFLRLISPWLWKCKWDWGSRISLEDWRLVCIIVDCLFIVKMRVQMYANDAKMCQRAWNIYRSQHELRNLMPVHLYRWRTSLSPIHWITLQDQFPKTCFANVHMWVFILPLGLKKLVSYDSKEATKGFTEVNCKKLVSSRRNLMIGIGKLTFSLRATRVYLPYTVQLKLPASSWYVFKRYCSLRLR